MDIKINTVYNMDCIELMREMERQGIVADWLIADPPYGIGIAEDYAKVGGEQYGKAATKKRVYTKKRGITKE